MHRQRRGSYELQGEMVFRSSVLTTTSPPPAASLNKLNKEVLKSPVLSRGTTESANLKEKSFCVLDWAYQQEHSIFTAREKGGVLRRVMRPLRTNHVYHSHPIKSVRKVIDKSDSQN